MSDVAGKGHKSEVMSVEPVSTPSSLLMGWSDRAPTPQREAGQGRKETRSRHVS